MAGIRQPEIVTTVNTVDPTVRVMNDAVDKNVACVVLYADATYLYMDSAKTIKATAEAVADAFIKGCVIDLSGVQYIPVSKKSTAANGNTKAYETLTYVKADTTTATTAVLATARSTN